MLNSSDNSLAITKLPINHYCLFPATKSIFYSPLDSWALVFGKYWSITQEFVKSLPKFMLTKSNTASLLTTDFFLRGLDRSFPYKAMHDYP